MFPKLSICLELNQTNFQWMINGNQSKCDMALGSKQWHSFMKLLLFFLYLKFHCIRLMSIVYFLYFLANY